MHSRIPKGVVRRLVTCRTFNTYFSYHICPFSTSPSFSLLPTSPSVSLRLPSLLSFAVTYGWFAPPSKNDPTDWTVVITCFGAMIQHTRHLDKINKVPLLSPRLFSPPSPLSPLLSSPPLLSPRLLSSPLLSSLPLFYQYKPRKSPVLCEAVQDHDWILVDILHKLRTTHLREEVSKREEGRGRRREGEDDNCRRRTGGEEGRAGGGDEIKGSLTYSSPMLVLRVRVYLAMSQNMHKLIL